MLRTRKWTNAPFQNCHVCCQSVNVSSTFWAGNHMIWTLSLSSYRFVYCLHFLHFHLICHLYQFSFRLFWDTFWALIQRQKMHSAKIKGNSKRNELVVEYLHVLERGSRGPSTVTLIALVYVATCGGLVDIVIVTEKLLPGKDNNK